MRRSKLILATMILAGSLSCLTVSGAYALLTAESQNRGATITSGTLTLDATVVETASTCYSYKLGGSANTNSACGALMSATTSPATWRYPGSTASAHVQIVNSGSIDGSTLKLYMPACAVATSPNATGHTGGGNPCAALFDAGSAAAGLQLAFQETTSGGAATRCWYPVQVAGSCTPVGNSFSAMWLNAATLGNAVGIGAGPAHGQTRYFIVSVTLPANAPNSLQGEQATFDLTWHLTT
jgi:hypothetical protein